MTPSPLGQAAGDLEEDSAGLRDLAKILVGGGPVDRACAGSIGADYYCRTTEDGAPAANRVLGVS
jgi:methanogenic corrinoid protein MtbC1